MNCNACGKWNEAGARFCTQCGTVMTYETVVPPVATRLFRPRQGRMLAGVCAAFALRYGWDVSLVRIVLLLLVVFGCGSPVVAYLIAWIAIPNELYPVTPYVPMTPAAQGPGPVPSTPYTGDSGPTAS